MTAGAADPLVTDYLTRLSAAAAALPPDRRAELMAEISEHIDAARAAGAPGDEAALRTVLDRLGEPTEIVAAAAADLPPPPAPPMAFPLPPRRAGLGLETAAVILLTLGSFIPVLGWLVGAVLLWCSPRWRPGEKLLGTLVVPGGPGVLLLLAGLPTQSCTGSTGSVGAPGAGAPTPTATSVETCTGFAFPPAVGIPLAVFILIAPFVVAAVLLSRARARAAGAQS
jgi:hypothetical protein